MNITLSESTGESLDGHVDSHGMSRRMCSVRGLVQTIVLLKGVIFMVQNVHVPQKNPGCTK